MQNVKFPEKSLPHKNDDIFEVGTSLNISILIKILLNILYTTPRYPRTSSRAWIQKAFLFEL